MAIAITIPRLGWNMEEGVFVGWLKQDGDEVRPATPCSPWRARRPRKTSNASMRASCASPPGGPKAGDRIAVGAVIGYVAAAGRGNAG